MAELAGKRFENPDQVRGFKRGHLLYFVTVAEEGQFTLAAQRLFIAQPALSQAIASLESDLGVQLLERHRRGVTLTPAGEVFLEKARAALAAEEDALLTTQSLVRADQRAILLGYLGLPPPLKNPDLIVAFTEAHPDIEISQHELPYPTLPTASWLREVDVAICSRPAADPNICFQPLRAEPRAVLAPKRHPLAQRRELTVAEVLDETFLGFHPSTDPAWAAFWGLDEYRGGPARHLIPEARNAQERFGMLATGRGIAVVPARHAAVVVEILRGVVAIPLTDADPANITLVAHKDRRNPLVEALFATARQLTAQVADDSSVTDN